MYIHQLRGCGFTDVNDGKVTFDPVKRDWTLHNRRLDFVDAALVFLGHTYDEVDTRFEYGEIRTITVGHLRDRMVVVVWTQRGSARHVISMRKANERERKRYAQYLFRPG